MSLNNSDPEKTEDLHTISDCYNPWRRFFDADAARKIVREELERVGLKPKHFLDWDAEEFTKLKADFARQRGTK